MWQDELTKLFCGKNIKFSEYADMSRLTSMRLGGRTRLLAEPADEVELVYVVREAQATRANYRVVGGLTNTLVTDGLYDGLLISTERIDSVVFTENNGVFAEAGAPLSAIVRNAALRGVGGFAALVGIPGTLGGAVYGNAGAHSCSISDLVRGVRVYDILEDKICVLSASDIGYTYRNSLFKRSNGRYVILSATLQGTAVDPKSLFDEMNEYTTIRRSRQPLTKPSLGSVFKHPHGDFAPRLIESLGLKGLSVGGACVSTLHAGFIVNDGTATANDVRKLIEIIKEKVFDAYGIILEEEINYLV